MSFSSLTNAPGGERRLHPAGMVVSALAAVRSFTGAAAVPGIAVLFGSGLQTRTVVLILSGLLLILIGSAIWGVLSWRATTFGVSNATFYLKQGVVQKSERSLPLERIQSVNTVQGIVQRFFQVFEVRVEAAGGGAEPEISLSALSRPDAEALREELTRRSRVSEGVEAEEEEQPEVLRRLHRPSLLVAGLTSGQIGVALPLIFFAFQFFENALPDEVSERLARSVLPEAAFYAFLAVLLGAVLVAWLLAITGTVLAHTGFTLSRSADGKYLHIRRGLLERHETTVPLARIQAIKLIEGILRQPFGLAEIRVESAGFGNEEGVSTTLFPLLPRKEAEALVRAAAPEFAAPLRELEPLPARARFRYAFRTTVPVLALAGLYGALFQPWGLLALGLGVPAALYGLLRYRDAGWSLDGGRVILRSRALARTTVVAPRLRLQSRSVSTSPLQRRKRLATLQIEVASGGGGAAFGLKDLGSETAYDLLEELHGRREGQEVAS